MKILKKVQFKVTLIALAVVLAVSGVLGVALSRNVGTSGGSETSINTDVNTLSVEEGLTEEKAKAEFDMSKATLDGDVATFTGYKTVSSKDLFGNTTCAVTGKDMGLLCDATYNKETGKIKITIVNTSNGETLLETSEGLLVDCGENKFDVVFEKDGEILYLSEIKEEETSAVTAYGFFDWIGEKISKVWNTTVGKIGTVATVVAAATVGVVCAVVPGGQLVTAVCVGAIVGAVGGAVTAGVSTYLEDGEIDWEAVGLWAGAGAVVGAATSAVSFKLTSAIKQVFTKANPSKDMKCFDSYSKFKGEYGKASNYVQNGEWHHIVEQNTVTKGINPANSVYNSRNTVAISRNLHTEVSRYYSSLTKSGQTFREFVNGLSYEQQFTEGLKVLKMLAEKLGETIFWL